MNIFLPHLLICTGPAVCDEDARSEPDGAGHHGPLQHGPEEWAHLLPGLLRHCPQAVAGGGRGGLQTKHVQGQIFAFFTFYI